MASSTQLFEGASHFISLAQAKQMTALYRAQKEDILEPAFRQRNILLTCETFNRSAFDSILGEGQCAGIRFYFGMNDDLQVKIIAVGVDLEGNDILPTSMDVTSPVDGNVAYIVEEGVPCPPICPNPPL